MSTDDDIDFAVRWASLAPSSHNCQPWRVLRCARDFYLRHVDPGAEAHAGWHEALVLGVDPARALSALPSLRREMCMSVGGFAALLHNFLRLHGFAVLPQLLPAAWTPASATGAARLGAEAVAVFLVGERTVPVQSEALARLLALAQRRTTQRVPFRRQGALEPSFDIGRALPHRLRPDAGLHWRMCAAAAQIDALAHFVARHAERDFSDADVWAETYRYIDFSGRHGEVPGVGFNIQQLLGPMPGWKRAAYRRVLAPALMPLSRRLGMARRIAVQLGALVADSAAIFYLSYDGPAADVAEQHLLAGESVLRLWLALTDSGLALHPVSVVLQHTDVREKLERLLGEPGEIWFFARVGEPAGPPPPFRYRQPLESFCHRAA